MPMQWLRLVFVSALAVLVWPLLCGDLLAGVGVQLVAGQTTYVTNPLCSADVHTLWASTFDGPRAASYSHLFGVSVDPNDGSVVLVGAASGTYLGHTSFGDQDAFVLKMAPSGYVVWARWFATALADWALAVDIDLNGNIMIAGTTSGSMPGFTNLGGSDVFVVSVTANGDQRWFKQFGTTSYDYAADVAVDVYGAVYVAWQTNTNSAAALTKLASNSSTLFTQYYGSYTNFLSSSVGDSQRGLALLNPVANLTATTDVIVVVALVTTSSSTYPWAPYSNAGGQDIIVSRVNTSSGVPVWSRIYQTAGQDVPTDLAMDSAGMVWLTGMTQASLEGGTYVGYNSNWNGFLSKLSSDGSKLFTVQFGAGTSNVYATALLVDNAGGVYVGGVNEQRSAQPLLDGLPTLYGTAGANSYYANQLDAGILSKYDSDGFRLWTAAFDSTLPNHLTTYNYMLAGMYTTHLAFDPATGQMYIVGQHTGLFNASDVDPIPHLADADYGQQQAFIIAAQQPVYNVSLAQYQDLLNQLDLLLNITML